MNVISSSADPSVRIEVPKSTRYVGTDAWVLYGIANCRQFVYVQAAVPSEIRRLYWVQFEAYLPSMPKLHHRYTSKRHMTLGGFNFYVDTWIEQNDGPNAHAADVASLAAFLRSEGYAVPAAINSGSDEQHVDALLAGKGYRLSPTTMSVRLVHLADARERAELMIIYSEALTDEGLTPVDAKEGATGYERWKVLERGLLRRVKESVTISTP